MKKGKWNLIVVTLMMFLLCIAGCTAVAEKPVDKAEIVLNAETQTIEMYREYRLEANTFHTTEQIEWSTSDAAVAVVEGGLVRGIKKGEAIITAKVGDAFDVCKVIVTEATAEPELFVNQSSISLNESDEICITATVQYKGVDVTTSEVSWSCADDETATVKTDSSDSKKAIIKGTHYGAVEIVATTLYVDKELKTTVYVSVQRPVIDLTAEQNTIYIEENVSSNFKAPEAISEDDIVEAVYVGEVDVFESYDIDTRTVSIKTAETDMEYGTTPIVVYTRDKAYMFEAIYCTMAIADAEDLDTFAEVAKQKLDGYYVLADDIDYRTKINEEEYKNTHFKTFISINAEFNGVFDGQGHFIRGMTIKGYDCGFIRCLGSDGVIKRVAFIEAQMGGNGSWNELVVGEKMAAEAAQNKDTGADKGGYVVQINKGLVSNVFVSGKIVSDGVPWLAQGGINTLLVSYGGRVEQCMVECLGGPVTENTNADGKIVRRWGSFSIVDNKQMLKEVFGLGGRVMIVTVANDSWTEPEWSQWNPTYSYTLLSQSAEQLNSKEGAWANFQESISQWDTSIWNIETKIPMFRSHYNMMSDSEKEAYDRRNDSESS